MDGRTPPTRRDIDTRSWLPWSGLVIMASTVRGSRSCPIAIRARDCHDMATTRIAWLQRCDYAHHADQGHLTVQDRLHSSEDA